MTFPSPHPAAQNSIASGTNQNSGARIVRTQQSAWGLPPPAPGVQRGLTPLSTDLASSSLDTSGPPASITSTSPFTSTFSSVVNASNRNNARASYSASPSASPFSPLQTGSQSHSSQILSPRSRTITPSSSSNLASSAVSTTAAQGGGGSGGGGRNSVFSPLPQQTLSSPTNNTFDRSAFIGSSSTPTNSGQSSVSKIVATQVFLLLGSITEKEGKAKWDSQAEAIRKVCSLLTMLMMLTWLL